MEAFRMPRWLQYTFACFIGLLLFGVPCVYARYCYRTWRNFHVVSDGILYRSGQLTLDGLAQVVHDFRIKTVVTLRDAHIVGDDPPDLDEEEWCRKEELNHFRLAPQPWVAADGSVPNLVNVVKFREIMSNPANYPVLVHCLAGKHRTGAMCAVFRMEHDHWTNQQAIDELEVYGYDNVQEHLDLLGFLTAYRPRWKPTGDQ
jgi:tyrosine-protein phosphatase SIW14